MTVRTADLEDNAQIVEIYNTYVRSSHATFEVEPINAAEMALRMGESIDGAYPSLVAEENGCIAGYAFGHRFRPRAAYLHSIELSVYIDDRFTGRGIGTALYSILIPDIISKGFHAVIAGISLPNDASIKLHEKFGFEKIAHFREVGLKFERWIDVGYWELIGTKN